jgi:hypothetical protein
LQQKKEREAKRLQAKLEQEKEQQRKEKLKSEFFRRIVNEQVQRARVVNAAREMKEHRLQQEKAELKRDREVAKLENKLMFAEDTQYHLFLEKQRRKIAAHGKQNHVTVKGVKERPGSAAPGRTPRHDPEAEAEAKERDKAGVAKEAELEAPVAKKPRIPRAPIVHKKPVELSEEEREVQELQRQFQERQKAEQLVLYKLKNTVIFNWKHECRRLIKQR